MRQSSVAVKVCGFGAPRFTISFSFFGVSGTLTMESGILYLHRKGYSIFIWLQLSFLCVMRLSHVISNMKLSCECWSLHIINK